MVASSLILLIVLVLAVLAFGRPGTFLFDLMDPVFSRGLPFRRR